jgi:hypothetical protein
MVIELLPFVMDMPAPAVNVAAAGVLVPPITTCPEVKDNDVRAAVELVPLITTPLVLKLVDPVPPPATTAVPKIGCAAAP